MPEQPILQVAIPLPLHRLFDYLPPAGVDQRELLPGIRILVPFGRGECCAVLIRVTSPQSSSSRQLKTALRLLDRSPLFAAADLQLLQWAASYYQHPLGEVIISALPTRLRSCREQLSLQLPGWRLTAVGSQQDPAALKRAPRQRTLLQRLQAEPDGITRQQLDAECGSCQTQLRLFQQRGWIDSCQLSPKRQHAPSESPQQPPTLHADQQRAVSRVAQAWRQFAVYLLDGITGSGKTEVYLQLIERVVADDGQVLLLVPEISLTPQLLRRFQRRLTVPVVVLHSGLSARARELAWQQARQGDARVVVGTRSAIFTPLPRLQLILVDEEHDLSLKQQEGFRYSARDLAVVRARQQQCPVMLGSATPSFETLRNASEGRYQHLHLPRRAGGATTPRLDLLDIRSVRLQAGVSPTLMRLIDEELQLGNQVLLFLNRRGYAPLLTCHDCGWVAQCRHCDARMTLHLRSNLLWCHHCGARQRPPNDCPDCHNDTLKPLGQGTERLQEDLAKRFPGHSIARIDRDATRRRGSLEGLLKEIHAGKHSLLVGTQMLAKGHHFPDVTLVGILDIDHGLFGADFRAAERMAQLLTQVAGRAGRAEKPGRVIIQTHHPDHPLLQTLLQQGFAAFADISMQERRAAQLPPYSHQALLRAEAHDDQAATRFLEQAAELARRSNLQGVSLWGPVPAPMERRAGRFRAQLLLQAAQRGSLQALLNTWLPQLRQMKGVAQVRWSLDVDPQEML